MISIVRINEENATLLSELSTQTFIESHGHSASEEDIHEFVTKNYNTEALQKELQDATNIFHLLNFNNKAAGFCKVLLNFPYPNSSSSAVAKLERIYLLQEYYDLHLGQQLLSFIINLAKENKQAGIWLFVWTENERAIRFYTKNGFVIISSHQYKISETHSNPNYLMLLRFH